MIFACIKIAFILQSQILIHKIIFSYNVLMPPRMLHNISKDLIIKPNQWSKIYSSNSLYLPWILTFGKILEFLSTLESYK